MKRSESTGVVLTLTFAVASFLLLQPASAAGAIASSSVEPLSTFYRSLNAKKGVYYVASPEVIGAPQSGPFDFRHSYITVDEKRVELEHGYVIVYGKNEALASRLELARENMRVISSHLPQSFAVHAAEPLQVGGEFSIDKLAEAESQFCGLALVRGQNAGLTLFTSGNWVSTKQLCVGFGIVAALGGYRIVPKKEGLELRREFDVGQSAALEGAQAPKGSRAKKALPVQAS